MKMSFAVRLCLDFRTTALTGVKLELPDEPVFDDMELAL